MHIFYTPEIAQKHELSEEESNHAVKVLRLSEGDEILLIDGKGKFYYATITRAHHKRCAFEVNRIEDEKSVIPSFIHIAVAPTKNIDRIEWFAEKTTEIGVSAITMLKCRYSERKDVKEERLNKILISASKQSLKATVPTLEGMTDFKEFVKRPFDGQKFIAHCCKDEAKKEFKNLYQKGQNVLVLIGPEGDFSNEEIEMALQNGFIPVSFGDSRLRTETAALVACHTIHVLN